MKIEQSFTVEAGVEEVWAALVDVERIAPCLPGAELTEAGEDGTYRGNFQVKLGPTTAAYRGTLKMESLDEAAHVATMSANGQDKRGQGTAKATIVSTLSESGGATTVDVVTDFTITGKLARFGRGGMIQDVSKRLLRDFADCLQQTIQAPAAAAAGPAPAAAGRDAGAAVPGAPDAGAAAAVSAGAPEGSGGFSGPGDGHEGAPAADRGAPAADRGAPAVDRSQAAPAPAAAPGSAPEPRAAPPASPPSRDAPAASAPAAKPVRGLSLLLSVLWERIRRALGRAS